MPDLRGDLGAERRVLGAGPCIERIDELLFPVAAGEQLDRRLVLLELVADKDVGENVVAGEAAAFRPLGTDNIAPVMVAPDPAVQSEPPPRFGQ